MKEDIFEDELDEEEEPAKIFSPKWGRIILILMIGAAFVVGYFAYCNNRYTDYDVQGVVHRASSDNTNFRSFNGKLFSYSRDGAMLSNFDGSPIWNESYDLETPVCDANGGYLLVYDKESTAIYIFAAEGLVGNLSMTLPIVRASVAGNGNVAVLMQDDETAYLRMYDPKGNVIASGEVHAKNTGYPVAMDLSDDSTKLMVSLLDLNDGDVKTTLCFYDFSASSNEEDNHVAANFSYADQVLPEVAFLKDGAVAFGDEELVFFQTDKEISVKKEVFLNEEVSAVFYSGEQAAVVTAVDSNGKGVHTLHTYNLSGAEGFSTRVPANMSYYGFMDNGEILLHNGKNIRIYKSNGVEKFSGKAKEAIRTVIPWDGQRNYYFIAADETQKVVLQ